MLHITSPELKHLLTKNLYHLKQHFPHPLVLTITNLFCFYELLFFQIEYIAYSICLSLTFSLSIMTSSFIYVVMNGKLFFIFMVEKYFNVLMCVAVTLPLSICPSVDTRQFPCVSSSSTFWKSLRRLNINSYSIVWQNSLVK